jgi:heat shock protein HslJ
MCWGARRGFVNSMGFAVAAFAALCLLATDAHAQSFPFGRELVLDVSPMRGSKKVPVLDIGDRGTAEIDLWCSSVRAQLVIAANTITIITGEKASRSCAPDLVRADDDLIDALNQATNWRMENYSLVFTGGAGGKTLRFRIQTN